MVLNQSERTFLYCLDRFVFLSGDISGSSAGPVYKGRFQWQTHVILHGHKRTAKIGGKLEFVRLRQIFS